MKVIILLGLLFGFSPVPLAALLFYGSAVGAVGKTRGGGYEDLKP